MPAARPPILVPHGRPSVPPEERLAVGSAVGMLLRHFTTNGPRDGDFNPDDRGIRTILRPRLVGASPSKHMARLRGWLQIRAAERASGHN